MSSSDAAGARPVERPNLVVDLLAWIGPDGRAYDEVMGAWRTTCPQLPVWEDALDHGLVRVDRDRPGAGLWVTVTDAGRTFASRQR